MEQTALRPKPMPGQDPGAGAAPDGDRPPPGGHRRRRRLTTLLLGVLAATVLLLSGVGLGTMGATVIGMSKLAELQRQAGAPGAGAEQPSGTRAAPVPPSAGASPSASPARVVATLGVEAVDDDKPGALVVGVHVPGPGYEAGLVRGDVLLAFGRTRIDSATDLAEAVADARPGKRVKITVRHESGGYQQLTAVPGVVT
ncbi:membrane-associated protease RseP (regulator of RpoE activity) [Streptomyces sp. DSM 42143]|uniref:PDZ domain-containing protein n=1 Tax=Streptomyces TaxID=1883 RepID=UPI0025B1F5F9|nr:MULTISPECIES: PDZ domain-containing protein [unclassified Streptomyces]MDN3247137.1 PDZ domain-containing protein [Streptomyces sp. ZSW22]MDQ0384694.1 membrane-associated protease RseP (regulator of RpoE activity) [Streptomyces sp. DSM 42143]